MKSNILTLHNRLNIWANSSAVYAEYLERLDLIECIRNRSEINSSLPERLGGRGSDVADSVSRIVINEEMLTNIENESKAKLAELRELRRYVDTLINDEFGGDSAMARNILLAFYRDKQSWENIAKSNHLNVRDVRMYEERVIARMCRPPYPDIRRKRLNSRLSAYHLLSARTNLMRKTMPS